MTLVFKEQKAKSKELHVKEILVYTGQHQDVNMLEIFLKIRHSSPLTQSAHKQLDQSPEYRPHV